MANSVSFFHFVNTTKIKSQSENELVIESVMNKVWNPTFTLGTILFVSSMLLRGYMDLKIGALFLAASTFILLSGVWKLSAVGTIVFDKVQGKIFCEYKHLGYLRKEYVFQLSSVDGVVVNGKNYWLQFDDNRILTLNNSTQFDEKTTSLCSEAVTAFIQAAKAK